MLVKLFIPVDVLAIKCDSNPCDPNAICQDTETSYECTCRSGFTGDGKSCLGM